jgi:hypothetical protein
MLDPDPNLIPGKECILVLFPVPKKLWFPAAAYLQINAMKMNVLHTNQKVL